MAVENVQPAERVLATGNVWKRCTRAGGAKAEQEDRGAVIFLEVLHDGLTLLGFPGEDVRRDLASLALGLEESEHLHKL